MRRWSDWRAQLLGPGSPLRCGRDDNCCSFEVVIPAKPPCRKTRWQRAGTQNWRSVGWALLSLWAVSPAYAADPLPALGADANSTSVSGISSGAYMAGQYEIAHSSSVVGAAIIAGGPYGCAEAKYADLMGDAAHLAMNASQSVSGCMLNALSWYGIPDTAALADRAKDLAASGKIDPIENLKKHRIYVFSGLSDQIVAHEIVVDAAEVYLRLGVPKEKILTGPRLQAGHGFVTDQQDAGCALSASPYVVHCGYDQAGDLLAQIYGTLAPKTGQPAGDLISFDQRPYGASANLAPDGAVYVPAACRKEKGCRVHVAFHGCSQSRDMVGDAFVSGTGFAPWADANRIIVLYPQVAADPMSNPLGCWDWWGYTGFGYLTRDAPQIAAVHAMVAKLASKP